MDQDISNWKNLWEGKKSNPVDISALISQLTSVEKKNKRERVILAVIFPLTILIITILLPVFQSAYYFLSISCIAIGMLMILLQLRKSKLKKSDNEDGFSNQEFIKATIKSLKTKMIITSRYMWVYTVLLLLSLNIGYIEVLKSLSFSARISIHVALTIAILSFMFVGIKKRSLKNKEEIVPLINDLEDMVRD